MYAETSRLRLWRIVAAVILTTLTLIGGRILAADQRDSNAVFDPALYSAMKHGLVGPFRGGRVTAVAGVPGQPYTFYFGSTGGGVWKTTSAGEAWKNISDGYFGVGSIGAISVAPSDPNVVYAGTGSACPRGNVSTGDGVYRSTDAGKSWQHVGLGDTGQIGRIVVHPEDPDLVYVAALGHIFGPNEERGVFRSGDGGRTWETVLYVSDRAGAVDLTMNPGNPRNLFASIWRPERKPWTMIDGGETWSSQHDQPTAEFCRVTVDNQFPYRLYGARRDNSTISVPSWAPNVLTAEESWFDVGGGESGHIAVHPDDPDIIYAGTYIGRIDRYDRRASFGRKVVIYPQMQDGISPKDLKYRCQWNAPIRFSPHDPDVIYHTSNHVHRSRNGGMSWQTISPDLTRNEPEKQGLQGGRRNMTTRVWRSSTRSSLSKSLRSWLESSGQVVTMGSSTCPKTTGPPGPTSLRPG